MNFLFILVQCSPTPTKRTPPPVMPKPTPPTHTAGTAGATRARAYTTMSPPTSRTRTRAPFADDSEAVYVEIGPASLALRDSVCGADSSSDSNTGDSEDETSSSGEEFDI